MCSWCIGTFGKLETPRDRLAPALIRFEETRHMRAGPTDRMTGGNGSLMRLSPVAVRYWNDPDRLRDTARRQSYTTHGAQVAVDACEAFSAILAATIPGKPSRTF